jgi:hypothetical protein
MATASRLIFSDVRAEKREHRHGEMSRRGVRGGVEGPIRTVGVCDEPTTLLSTSGRKGLVRLRVVAECVLSEAALEGALSSAQRRGDAGPCSLR